MTQYNWMEGRLLEKYDRLTIKKSWGQFEEKHSLSYSKINSYSVIFYQYTVISRLIAAAIIIKHGWNVINEFYII